MASRRIKIGILGTGAQAVTFVKLAPSLEADIQLVAVASHKGGIDHAKAFSDKYEIPRSYGGYETLIQDNDIDAVYIACPNSQHCKWAVAALESGKHVLVERPMASNAGEAREMADTARRTGLVLMEALGYKFHPFMKRVKEIVEKGEIGEVQSVDSRFFLPTLSGKNWRYSYAEGGGALMDTGVAALDAARHVLGDVSLICEDAKVKLAYPQVDMDCTATFLATTGAKVFVDCSIWSLGPRISMVIKGQDGAELTIRNWAMPHTVYNAILVTDRNGCKRTEKYETGEPTTYTLNVRSFIEVIRNRDTVNLGSPENAVTNMELVDSVYEKAGLVPRGRTLPTEGAEGAEGAAPAN